MLPDNSEACTVFVRHLEHRGVPQGLVFWGGSSEVLFHGGLNGLE